MYAFRTGINDTWRRTAVKNTAAFYLSLNVEKYTGMCYNMTIGIVGLGLIGASIAKTVRKHTDFAESRLCFPDYGRKNKRR